MASLKNLSMLLLLDRPNQCNYPRHKTRVKALLSFCMANDDYLGANLGYINIYSGGE
jgi:hypothetical protein